MQNLLLGDSFGLILTSFENFENGKVAHEHIYASQLARNAQRSFETEVKQEDEVHLLCRYCGSPDLRKCGFRYNAHGIAHRYYCYQCQRKFEFSQGDMSFLNALVDTHQQLDPKSLRD